MTDREIKHRRNMIEHAKKLVDWAPEKIKRSYQEYLDRLENDLEAKLKIPSGS